MKAIILAASLLLFACSQQRFEVLQQASRDTYAVIYDRQTGHVTRILSGGDMEVINYPGR
jgi:hypothetical protein